MVLFTCDCCNYSTSSNSNFKKHLKTKKHRVNEECSLKDPKELEEWTQKDPQKTQKDPQKTQKDPQKLDKNPEKYKCDYCIDDFSSYAHKRRHELHR